MSSVTRGPASVRVRFAPLVALALLVALTPAARAQAVYRPPVDVPLVVLRGFEPPGHAFGPGHRGVDLDLAAGAPVLAAAAGTVTHAGDVAGVTWASVDHGDGVTTSYGPLSDLRVATGDEVAAGEILGVLAAGGHGERSGDRGLHWGARRDGTYIDPLTLLGPDRVPSLVGPGGWRPTDLVVEAWDEEFDASRNRFGNLFSPTADRPGFALAPNHHHVVLVGGLNSGDGTPLFDPRLIGYDEDSTTRFSYAGLDDDGQPLSYGPPDTWDGIDAAAQRLAEQLRAQQAAQPYRPVDLVGHSQGGVVILHYLTHYHDPYDPALPAIANVMTFASPHRGSDIATLGKTVRDNLFTAPFLELGVLAYDWHGDHFRGTIRQPLDELSVGSGYLRQLSRDWEDAVTAGPAGPLAAGTRILTVGGSRDQIVGSHRALLPGSNGDAEQLLDHRVLPGGHERVQLTEAAHGVAYDFFGYGDVVESPGHVERAGARAAGFSWRLVGGALDAADIRGSIRRALAPRPSGAEAEFMRPDVLERLEAETR